MSDDTDKLAFALLTSIKWAVDGGKIEELPRVHEELTEALDIIFHKRLIADAASLKTRKDSTIFEVLQKNNGNISHTAEALGVSRGTISNCIKRRITQ